MIDCQKIKKSYGNQVVLDQVTYSIRHTGIHAITGTSGCGKTTFSRLLLGLEQPDSGQITYDVSLECSVLFPEDRLLPTLTAYQNIAYVNPTSTHTANLLSMVQLEDYRDHYPAQLSSGMKRRVALARALNFPADLLILDEPFKGLDLNLQHYLLEHLQNYAKSKAILLIHHEWSLLQSVAVSHLDLEQAGQGY